jgi:sporulation protein YlmC with PRC-barrel domain
MGEPGETSIRDGIIGKSVIGQHGREIGRVLDVGIDAESWKVISLQVKLSRKVHHDLNLKQLLFRSQTVTLPIAEVSGVSDTVVLRIALDKLAFSGGIPEAEPRKELPAGEDSSG